jgi:trehalose 6-phosphate synthase
MAEGIALALTMSRDEQGERMKLMRQQVKEHNVYRWAGAMLVDAARSRTHARILSLSTSRERTRKSQSDAIVRARREGD